MLIKASEYYIKRIGICSITSIVGKEKKLAFDKGEVIEVTEEQAEIINQLGWGKEAENVS